MELTPDEFDTTVMKEFGELGEENDELEPGLHENNELEPEFDETDTRVPEPTPFGFVNPALVGPAQTNNAQTTAMSFRMTIELDLERAILAKANAEKAQRRANKALAKAQAISVTMGGVDKSLEKAKIGKNDFNRKHALTLLADKEQQSMLDAEDALTDAKALYEIHNNRAIDAGLLR